MAQYKLYFLTAAGRVARAKNLNCDGDAEALRLLLNHPRHETMELWQGVKRLRALPALSDPAPDYSVYLLDHDAIVAMTAIAAPTDVTACAMAAHIFHASNDRCDAFEVWQGERWIQAQLHADMELAGDRVAVPEVFTSRLASLERHHQGVVINREMVLQDSYAAIRKSRKLLETLQALKPLYGPFP